MTKALLLLILACGPAAAQDLGAGARPMGMGNAFTALADDSSALHFNPAGLSLLSRPELSAGYSKLYMGLSDGSNIGHSFMAYAHPLKRGTLAAGILDLKLSGAFNERSYVFSYARSVLPSLSVGGSLKLLERSYDLGGDPHLTADPVFAGGKSRARGMGFDLAALYRSPGPFSAGLSIAELNQPDLGLKSSDRVPRTVRLGAAYRPPDFTFDGDLVLKDGDWDFLLGMERSFARSLVARMGFGLGSRSDRDVSAGASFRAQHVQIDYAFLFPLAGISSTAGTHRFTFTVRFGPPPQGWDSGPKPREPDPTAGVLEDRVKSMGEELEKARKGQEETNEILKRLEQKLSSPRPEPRKAPVSAAPVPARPKVHVVSEGETLQSIAQKMYGDSGRWMDIYRVNQDQIGPGGRLNKGLRLTLP